MEDGDLANPATSVSYKLYLTQYQLFVESKSKASRAPILRKISTKIMSSGVIWRFLVKLKIPLLRKIPNLETPLSMKALYWESFRKNSRNLLLITNDSLLCDKKWTSPSRLYKVVLRFQCSSWVSEEILNFLVGI